MRKEKIGRRKTHRVDPGSEGASLLPSGTNESPWQLLRNLHLLVPVHL